jgi:hypothetical protein
LVTAIEKVKSGVLMEDKRRPGIIKTTAFIATSNAILSYAHSMFGALVSDTKISFWAQKVADVQLGFCVAAAMVCIVSYVFWKMSSEGSSR